MFFQPTEKTRSIRWLRTRADRACPLRHRAELVWIALPALICIFIIQIALVYQPCLAALCLRCGVWINLNFWHSPSRVSDYLFPVWLTNQRFYLCLIRAGGCLLSQSSSCFSNDYGAKKVNVIRERRAQVVQSRIISLSVLVYFLFFFKTNSAGEMFW